MLALFLKTDLERKSNSLALEGVRRSLSFPLSDVNASEVRGI